LEHCATYNVWFNLFWSIVLHTMYNNIDSRKLNLHFLIFIIRYKLFWYYYECDHKKSYFSEYLATLLNYCQRWSSWCFDTDESHLDTIATDTDTVVTDRCHILGQHDKNVTGYTDGTGKKRLSCYCCNL
jgi:hypothetical protein